MTPLKQLLTCSLVACYLFGICSPTDWHALQDIGTWRYPGLEQRLAGRPGNQPTSRLWDRDQLRNSNAVVHMEQMRGLVAKLERGERVVVTAVGSSMVQNFAGCWGLPERVQEVVPTLHLTYNPKHGICRADSHPDSDPGWIHSLLLMINQTWPHKDHLMVNVGSGGHTFKAYALQGCLDTHIPVATDLLILEQNEDMDPRDSSVLAERFLWRLSMHFRGSASADKGWVAPPVILVNTISVALNTRENVHCLRDAQNCDNDPCGVNFSHSLGPHSTATKAEDIYEPLIQYFGYTALSLRNFYNGLLRDGVLERWGFKPCNFFSAMTIDVMHPDTLGQVLLGDMLVNHLVEALEAFEKPAPVPAVSKLPLLPLNPGGNRIFLSRCYGTIEASREDEHLSAEAHGFASLAGVNTLGSLQVVNNQGWEYVEFSPGVNGAAGKYKPGWQATMAESVFQMQVDSKFGMADDAEKKNATIVLMYLKSYENMGMAELTCVQNCVCQGGVLNAHSVAQKISVIGWEHFPATQHPECVLQLKVLKDTRSSGHKFKIVQVAITMETWA